MEHDAPLPPVLVAEGPVDEGSEPGAEEEGRDEPALVVDEKKRCVSSSCRTGAGNPM